MTEDFYDLLDVSPDASQDEITSAYREKVRDYHPDVNDDDRAQAQFTALTKANEILGDPVERRAYDRLGHETYVAKRTSGIPSPDVWASRVDDSERSVTESPAAADDNPSETGRGATAGEKTGTATGSDSQMSSGTTGAHAGDSSRSDRARTRSTTDRSTTDRTSESSTSADSAGSTTQSTATTTTHTTKTNRETATTGESTASRATGGTATGRSSATAGSTGTRSSTRTTTPSEPARADNSVVRWWRRRNVAMPLLWCSLVVYLAGVAHYAGANETALETLWADLRAGGLAPTAVWETLSSGRYGLETPLAFVTAVEPIAPSLPPTQWYGLLAGIVGLTVVAIGGSRLAIRSDPWGPITMDETIVLALALALSTGLYGGPLLAGTVLLPLLFGIVVHHTRRRPGWTPTYLYVVPVLAPIVGLGALAGGITSLPLELGAFVACPLVGGLWLPLRATIRKHLGR
ncbi:J domain-containing protein [Salinadaptatus halalkaliphilus]|uniref:J domain-containing protein n=1 Tax=Salinadaptatus halalkaliphilus TaxID=2419781 RepID=A0A4S3TRD4_9EURY|nr:J domain-containing protein [Salinadaptatus halalkaliphilus]THE65913.1 J domain-containing protein [Salinadaptatus halalkaliphilus]